MANNTLAPSLQVSEEEFSTFFGNSHLYFFLKFVYFVEATVGILVAKLNQSTKSKFVVNTLKLRDQSFFYECTFPAELIKHNSSVYPMCPLEENTRI